jgi:VCBS repeat-containing protein
VNDSNTTNEDVAVSGTLATNDSDPIDGTSISYTLVTGPAHGTFSLASNGTYTYTPAPNYNGTDMVIVNACDQGIPLPAICFPDTLFITVLPINDAPVVSDTIAIIPEDSNFTICLNIADPDTGQTYTSSICGVQNGTASTAGTCITYVPTANYNGPDTICVITCDNGTPTLCDTSYIYVTVTPVNDPPIINNDSAVTNEDTPVSGTLATNDNDALDPTTIVYDTTAISGPAHGSIVIGTDGSYTYTPAANYNGTDRVITNACDAGTPLPALCRNDTLYLTINPVNDPPVIVDSGLVCGGCGVGWVNSGLG